MDTILVVLALVTGPVLPLFAAGAPLRFGGVDIALATLACLALWWRRACPVAVACVLIAISTVSASADSAAAAGLFTVAVHCEGRIVAPVAIVNLIAPVPRDLLLPDPRYPWWVPHAMTLFGTAVLVGWGMWIRARRQLVQSLDERARRAESEQLLRIEQARQTERTRIAREMHDALAHRISLLSMHAGALEFRPDAPAEEIAHAAGVIRSSAHQALHDLREVLGVLRDDDPAGGPERPQPGAADLDELVSEATKAGMKISWSCDVEQLGELPEVTGRSLYRIVQEALTNARKHAPGQRVSVRVSGGSYPGLTLEARNGLGTQPGGIPGAGMGLAGLAERVNLAGGRLEHGMDGSREFRLWVWLPWPS